MKKKILTLMPIAFILCSCNFKFKIKWPWSKDKEENNQNQVIIDEKTIDDEDAGPINIHASKLNCDPKASFYLRIGETRNLKLSFDQKPTLASERTFQWSASNDFVSFVVDSEDSMKATVKGVSAGTCTIKAINDYNSTLIGEFTVKVLDISDENSYLWQYDSSTDRKEFGYSTDTKAGTPSGVAVLNGREWSYTRSKASSLQTDYGALGFGKGKEPETLVHLETESNRVVEKIVVEAASANSLAKLTVKVGETAIFNQVQLDRVSYDVVGTLTSELCSAEGKITFDFVTPEYDPAGAEDPNYKAPGAVYLKSILIYFQEETIDRIEISEDSTMKVDYFKGESFSEQGLILEKVTSRGNRFVVDIENELVNENLKINYPSLDIADHVAKDVILSLKVRGYDEPFTTSYKIHIRDEAWTPESISVEGEVERQNLTAGDEVDYSGLKIKVIYDSVSSDIMICDFDFNNDVFTFSYGGDGDPFVAETDMMSGYTISVIGHFVPDAEGARSVTVGTTYVVPANTLSVLEAIYDRIDFRRKTTFEGLGLKTDTQEISFIPNDKSNCRIDFEKVKKGSRLSDNKELPITLSPFDVVVTNPNLTLDKLNIEFANASKKENNYRLFESIYGGDLYTTTDSIASAKNHKIIHNEFSEFANAVHLAPGLTSTGSNVNANTCIVSILVRYVEVPQVSYQISANDTVPTKLNYVEGEEFDPTGLAVELKSASPEATYNITSLMTWYDGATFAKAPQKTLTPESKTVVGVFHEKQIVVNIEGVEAKAISLVRVTDVSQFTADGKYYITSPSNHTILKGSTANSDIFTGKGCAVEEKYSFGDSMNINILYENDYFSFIPNENGTFKIQSQVGGFFGLTKGGTATCSKTCPNQDFEITINEDGTFSIKISAMGYDSHDEEKGISTYYLGSSEEIIKLYASDKANIVIYKMA